MAQIPGPVLAGTFSDRTASSLLSHLLSFTRHELRYRTRRNPACPLPRCTLEANCMLKGDLHYCSSMLVP